MKKTVRLIFIISMCFALTACRNNDFVNLSSFIDHYNAVSEEENRIDFSDFLIDDSENKQTASFFPFGTYNIAVRLENDALNQIGEARIVLRKTDKNIHPLTLTENDLNCFLQACNKTVFALSNREISEVPEQILPASVSELLKENEKTADCGGYYFIFYSNSLVSEVIIRNNQLKQTETTGKPENKVPFAQMTETRENTVPHK